MYGGGVDAEDDDTIQKHQELVRMCRTQSADTVKTCTTLGYAYASYTEVQQIQFEAEREMSFCSTV